MEFLIMWMIVWMFLEILIIDVQNIMLKIAEFILVVEMEKLMTEKLVEIVHRTYECAVEMVFWMSERVVKRVQ
jgi:hypothetical protein